MKNKPKLELVQYFCRQENKQKFMVQNLDEKTRIEVSIHALEGLSTTSFCKISEDEYFLYGGYKDNKESQLAFIFDIRKMSVEETTPFEIEIIGSKCIKFGEDVYCFGGIAPNKKQTTPYKFKLKSWIYEPLQFIPYKYNQIHSLFIYKSVICLILSNNRFVCYEPATGEWSFWKQHPYSFDFVFCFKDMLYLLNTRLKNICAYDIKEELVFIKTFLDFEASEFMFSNIKNELYILDHSTDIRSYYILNLESFTFEKKDNEEYLKFFSDGVLFKNHPTFEIEPIASKCQIIQKNNHHFETESLPAKKRKNQSNKVVIYGGYECPFSILADIEKKNFCVKPVSSKLPLRNSQGYSKLTPVEFMFAGGKSGDYHESSDVNVCIYNLESRSIKRLKDLPHETEFAMLANTGKEIYFLNESINFFKYDLRQNNWFKIRPNNHDSFFNYFIFKGRLFIFMTTRNQNNENDFVLEEYNQITDNWKIYTQLSVDFSIVAEFSWQTDRNKFIILGKNKNSSYPLIYEIQLTEKEEISKMTREKDCDFIGEAFDIQIKMLVQLTTKTIKTWDINPIPYNEFLLFFLVDKNLIPFNAIYDTKKQAVVENPELQYFYEELIKYLKIIRFRFEYLENLKVL